MTIIASQFRELVVKPALTALVPAGIPHTQFAEDLLMATAAQESLLGTYLVQVGGPALGPFMIEPASLLTLLGRVTLVQDAVLTSLGGGDAIGAQLPINFLLAAAICRLFYWQVPAALPTTSTLTNLWTYYKTHYNTSAGAATLMQFQATLKLTDITL